jgi:diacylglycerol O-acyltransferase
VHPAEAVTTARETAGLAGELAHLGLLPDDPSSSLKRPLSGVRRVAWSAPSPLEDVRTVAHVLGCSINDVLVASLAGALGRYLGKRGEDVSGMRLRAAVPVNLRREGDGAGELGNRFGLVFLELPVGLAHPLERLEAVRATMQSLKGSPQALVTLGLLTLIGSLPAAVEEPMMALFSAKASLVVSNVPGPREPLCFGGVPVLQAQFWVPQGGSIGVGVSMLTYNGTVQFGVISDRALIAEPAELVRMMCEELERLVLLLLLGALAQASPRRARSTSSRSIASAGTQAAALS